MTQECLTENSTEQEISLIRHNVTKYVFSLIEKRMRDGTEASCFAFIWITESATQSYFNV